MNYPSFLKKSITQFLLYQSLTFLCFTLISIPLCAQQTNDYLEYSGSWEEGVGLSIAVDNELTAIGDGSILKLMDTSDPDQAELVSTFKSYGPIMDLILDQNFAYLAINNQGLQIIDISDVQSPEMAGFIVISGWTPRIAKKGKYLFYSKHDHLYTLDVSDPENPEIKYDLDVENDFETIKVSGNLLYGGKGYYGYGIIDITDPESPAIIIEGDHPDNYLNDMTIRDQTAYFVSFDSLYVFDISDLSDIKKLHSEFFDSGIFVEIINGDTLILMSSYSNAKILDISNKLDPVLLATNSFSGGGRINQWRLENKSMAGISEHGSMINFSFSDIENTAFTAEKVAIGYTFKSYLFDDMLLLNNYTEGGNMISIEDPENPVFIAKVLIDNISSVAQMNGNYLYSKQGVYDLTDPFDPIEIGQTELSVNGHVRNSLIKEDFLYLADYSNGLFIIDISDPWDPIEMSLFEPEGNAVGVDVVGNLAYIACGSGGLTILDISDPSYPVEIGALEEIGNCSDVKIIGNAAHIAKYSSRSIIVDITDPNDPQLKDGNMKNRINHILLDETFAFVSGTSSGFRVYDVSNEFEPILLDSYLTPGLVYHSSYDGEYLYLADYYCGIQILKFDKTSQTLIEVHDKNDALSIYPNPTFQGMGIQLKSNISSQTTSEIYVYNISGKQVYSGKAGSFEKGDIINVEFDNELAPGTYFITLQANNYTHTEKLIIQ